MTKEYVNVLGTTYSIITDVPLESMPEEADGCIDISTRTIKIAEMKSDKNSVQDMETYRKKVLRHEIIHAFFYESGIWSNSTSSEPWGMDEQLTDWIAIQFPKLLNAFKWVDCL